MKEGLSSKQWLRGNEDVNKAGRECARGRYLSGTIQGKSLGAVELVSELHTELCSKSYRARNKRYVYLTCSAFSFSVCSVGAGL